MFAKSLDIAMFALLERFGRPHLGFFWLVLDPQEVQQKNWVLKSVTLILVVWTSFSTNLGYICGAKIISKRLPRIGLVLKPSGAS